MAVQTNTFKGARYVPKFADPIKWSAENSYEAIESVQHNGFTYLSKQPVPVGVEITNTEFWLEWADPNAQMEQLRQEVGQYADSVQELSGTVGNLSDDLGAEIVNRENADKEIKNDISVKSPVLEGCSVLVKTNDNAILLDCGYSSDGTRIENFLTQNVDKLDAVVITHFDSDHVGGFASVANFCDENTDIFIQMAPTTANSGYSIYQNGLTLVNDTITQKNLKAAVVPTEGSTYTYGDIEIELHNTTAGNKAAYDSIPGESVPYFDARSTINNYSLISIIDINGFTITYSGDIEALGQRLNTQYMRKCDIAFTPHHISSIWGYLPWWMAQSPKQWFATTAASTYEANINVNNRYVMGLIRYNYINDVIICHENPIDVKVQSGNYSIISGESLIGEMSEEDLQSVNTVIYQIVPPTYKNDNPKFLESMSLRELIGACAGNIGGMYTMADNTFSNLRADTQIIKDINAMFDGQNIVGTSAITFECGRLMKIIIHNSALYFNEIVCFGSVDPETKAGYFINHYTRSFKYLFEEPVMAQSLDLTQYLSTEEQAMLKRAHNVTLIVDGSNNMQMFRQTTVTSENINYGNVSLSGVCVDSNVEKIYFASLPQSTLALTAKARTLADNSITFVNVRAIIVNS